MCEFRDCDNRNITLRESFAICILEQDDAANSSISKLNFHTKHKLAHTHIHT